MVLHPKYVLLSIAAAILWVPTGIKWPHEVPTRPAPPLQVPDKEVFVPPPAEEVGYNFWDVLSATCDIILGAMLDIVLHLLILRLSTKYKPEEKLVQAVREKVSAECTNELESLRAMSSEVDKLEEQFDQTLKVVYMAIARSRKFRTAQGTVGRDGVKRRTVPTGPNGTRKQNALFHREPITELR
jgi:hypothetical protein